jgi:hypothetical protein
MEVLNRPLKRSVVLDGLPAKSWYGEEQAQRSKALSQSRYDQ